jgi:uncharacterized protein YxjI
MEKKFNTIDKEIDISDQTTDEIFLSKEEITRLRNLYEDVLRDSNFMPVLKKPLFILPMDKE